MGRGGGGWGAFNYNINRSTRTTHTNFHPTGVQTHDLWIMHSTFHVPEMIDLTAKSGRTQPLDHAQHSMACLELQYLDMITVDIPLEEQTAIKLIRGICVESVQFCCISMKTLGDLNLWDVATFCFTSAVPFLSIAYFQTFFEFSPFTDRHISFCLRGGKRPPIPAGDIRRNKDVFVDVSA